MVTVVGTFIQAPGRGLTCLKVGGMKRTNSDARLFSEHSPHGAFMTATILSETWPSFSPLLFAQYTDRDLEFDDGLEDFDAPRHKPPRRRWFAVLLFILLAVGTWYVVTDPERRSSIIQIMPDTVRTTLGIHTEDPAPEHEHNVPPSPNVPPVPAFHEGQRVTVALKEGRQARFRLRNEAEGEQRGPVVKTGDVLTIMDGSLIKKTWMYFVQTEAGEPGWIKERYLQPRS